MELEFLRWLHGRLAAEPRLAVGIGDDAAVFEALAGRLVATVDMLTDGVDFRLAEIDPQRAGHKALGVNLSDLAAMAARPLAALVSLALPREGALTLAQQLFEGLLPLARRFDVALAGGDTNTWDGPLAISITLLGETTEHGPLVRSGARPGDRILVTGSLGGSILGRHLDVEPRVNEALELHRLYRLNAGIDVSDGLALDLSRVCGASGCGAEVDLSSVPISAAAQALASRDGVSPLDHALADGEDFELLLAVPPAEARRILVEQPLSIPLTDIGEFVAGSGLWGRSNGHRAPLAPRGYEH